MTREDAVQVEINYRNLEELVSILEEYRRKGKSVFVDVYHRYYGTHNFLYSCDVNLRDAYISCFGLTREEQHNEDVAIMYAETDDEEKRVRRKFDRIRQKHIEEKKREAVQVQNIPGNLESVTKYLMECRKRGESVFYDFNGHRLYSWDITLEKASLQVHGMTLEERKELVGELTAAETEEEKEKILAKVEALKRQHAREAKEKELLDLVLEIEDYEVEKRAIQDKISGLKSKMQELKRDEPNGPGEEQ